VQARAFFAQFVQDSRCCRIVWIVGGYALYVLQADDCFFDVTEIRMSDACTKVRSQPFWRFENLRFAEVAYFSPVSLPF
jgi:hypothetical protein